MSHRGQTNTAGLALLILLVVLALGALTAGIGSVIHTGATAVETERVADELGEAIDPAPETASETTVEIGAGTVTTDQRSVRVIDGETASFTPGNQTVEVIDHQMASVVDYTIDDRQATVFGGGVFLDDGDGSRLHTRPGLIADEDPGGFLIVGVPQIQAPQSVLAEPGEPTVTVQTAVEPDRRVVGTQQYYLGIETEHADAWAQYLEELGATVVTTNARFDEDQHDSVVATFSGNRTVEIIEYRIELEVLEP